VLAAAALLVAAGLAGGSGLVPRPLELVVEDVTRHGRLLLREPVRPGDTFALSYVHSSEHVPVRGVFRIERDGSLTVLETAFGGFGPGLPALKPGDDWTIRDGMVVARVRDVRLPELIARVTATTRHRLRTARERELDLSALAQPLGRIAIRAR
jgi:hypothetical protein